MCQKTMHAYSGDTKVSTCKLSRADAENRNVKCIYGAKIERTPRRRKS